MIREPFFEYDLVRRYYRYMNKKRIDSHLDLHMILERGNYTYS